MIVTVIEEQKEEHTLTEHKDSRLSVGGDGEFHAFFLIKSGVYHA